MAAINGPPRPIFVTVLFGFAPAAYLTIGTVLVLALLYIHGHHSMGEVTQYSAFNSGRCAVSGSI